MATLIDALKADVDRLAKAGAAAPLATEASLRSASPGWDVAAVTRAAFWPDDPSVLNVDNVLVTTTRVRDESAVVFAVAHGNYKDEACTYASAATVATFAAELAQPLISEADIAPAIRRAMIAADERVAALGRADAPHGELWSVAGRRSNLTGIGASAILVVATTTYAWIAHVGENRALFVAPASVPKDLVLQHILGRDRALRAKHGVDSATLADHFDVVLQVLGYAGASMKIDVSRVPLSRGDRLIVGNASLGLVGLRVEGEQGEAVGDPMASCTRIAERMSAEAADRPVSVIVAERV